MTRPSKPTPAIKKNASPLAVAPCSLASLPRSKVLATSVAVPAAGAGISEVILLGGDTLSKLENLGTEVAAEIYVPESIRHDSAPFAYLQKWLPFEKKGDAVVKIKTAACGDRSRFQSK